jgi:class 3 adenylate cyclase
MFTDMKDFSRKMNMDEQLALSLLKKQNAIITRAVRRYSGRVIEIIGDAFLVVFESAVNAVMCGLTIQRDLQKHNRTKRTWERLDVRMGIHLGDVIEENGKLRGDAINIAARLQQIAAPGHISISGSVVAALQGKMRVRITKQGNRRVKNIRQPIAVYRVDIETLDEQRVP